MNGSRIKSIFNMKMMKKYNRVSERESWMATMMMMDDDSINSKDSNKQIILMDPRMAYLVDEDNEDNIMNSKVMEYTMRKMIKDNPISILNRG
jgi:hypothetical protein